MNFSKNIRYLIRISKEKITMDVSHDEEKISKIQKNMKNMMTKEPKKLIVTILQSTRAFAYTIFK